jgi:hypothetical protein
MQCRRSVVGTSEDEDFQKTANGFCLPFTYIVVIVNRSGVDFAVRPLAFQPLHLSA